MFFSEQRKVSIRLKMMNAFRLFPAFSGALLVLSAIAKLVSATGSAGILHEPDPVFLISFRSLFVIIGATELFVGMICIFGKKPAVQLTLLASLSTCFIIYRLSMNWMHYYKPCPCLGTLTASLHISPQVADTAMKYMAFLILVGSYCGLFLLSKQVSRAGVKTARCLAGFDS